ncbi:hypothetical protein ACPV5H_25940 [Vibrio harveyi]|uniref:hypothetical protein n=1 Tax=Vibrio harveyi TaxID=669 RepID=UPI0028741C0C|nr:hypothetical protein [Vibrio harveyi]ELI0637523.1 hypothetical protein [Vibrio harveyi]
MNIKLRTERFLHEVLEFEFSYQTQLHVREKIEADTDRFEVEQSVTGYPVRGSGIIASMVNIVSWSLHNETLIIDEQLVDPVETSDAVSFFPLDSVSIVYLYSLLEEYGNDIADHLAVTQRRRFQAWHSSVYADTDLNDPAKVQAMKTSFCNVFGFNTNSVPDTVIKSLVRLKLERNLIVHELEHSNSFYLCFKYVVLIACCIYFQATNDQGELKLFPWTDHDDNFK